MDKIVKNDNLRYQILFNRPLQKTKDEYIYGFRLKGSENFSEKRLLRYIVEAIFGKCLFESLHDGSFEGEDDEIWIDKETGVNYLYHSSGYAGGLTVLLDKDGKPVVTPIEEE